MKENKLVIFEKSEIRRIKFDTEWFYSLKDVAKALNGCADPKDYVKKLRKKKKSLSDSWGQLVRILPLPTKGGMQPTNCANKPGLLKIIPEIRTERREEFKKWLESVDE